MDWTPHPRQSEALSRSEREILYGGARGGGKTACGMTWLVEPEYISNPRFRGLVIRKSFKDLADWISKARVFMHGIAEIFTVPAEIRFPSGAIIALGHWGDPSAVGMYLGQEYQKILIEELTDVFANEEDYLKLLGSLRSSDPTLKPQVFCTTNPGGKGHCVPYGEVLTSVGWMGIANVRIGDMVASTDDSGALCYVPVQQLHSSYYSGALKQYVSDTMEITSTPEHSVWRVTETKTESGRVYHAPTPIKMCDVSEVTRVVRACTAWHGNSIDKFLVPYVHSRTQRYPQPTEISGDDYCELMGWFLSEGWVLKSKGSKDTRFGIAQSKPDNVVVIKALLDRCGFHYRYTGSCFEMYSNSWYEYFSQFGKCRDKFIPNAIKLATVEQISIFIKAAMLGDGHGKVYYTTSQRLADDIQELGLKIGYSPSIRSRQRKNRVGLSYSITLRDGRTGWMEKKDIQDVPYNGNVYCIGVPGHRFWLRQGGRVFLSGNSWTRKRWVDVAYNKTYYDPKTGSSRIFIPSKVDDNPSITENDPAYVAYLDGLPERLRRAWRDGSWDLAEGSFFQEFNKDLMLEPAFQIDETSSHQRLFASMDIGATHHTAFCLWYVAPDATIHLMMTYCQQLSSIRDHAKEIFDQIASHRPTKGYFPKIVWVGPDAWTKNKISEMTWRAPIDEFTELWNDTHKRGVTWEQANSYRANGCMIMQDLFKARNGKPQVFYIDKYNQQYEDAVPAVMINPNKPEEYLKTNSWTDDLTDCVRYGLVGIYTWLTGEKKAKALRLETQKFNEQFVNKDWYEM